MDAMSLRRNLLIRKKSRLPREYQEVEYISGTGTQYINSGIECTSDLVVEYECLCKSNANSAICGGIDVSQAPKYFRHHHSPRNSKSEYWMMFSTSHVPISFTPFEHNIRHYMFIDPVNGVAKIDGNQIAFTPLTSGLTTGKSYGILGRIADNDDIQAKPSTFYWFKFYRGDVLIGDFIPCYRKSDGEIGMYDTVSKTFFTNAGSGTFSKGADI